MEIDFLEKLFAFFRNLFCVPEESIVVPPAEKYYFPKKDIKFILSFY
jgi:hypothetical protein